MQSNKLSPEEAQQFRQSLTDAGRHGLVGWMLGCAAYSPRIAAEIRRYRDWAATPEAASINAFSPSASATSAKPAASHERTTLP